MKVDEDRVEMAVKVIIINMVLLITDEAKESASARDASDKVWCG
jgi:hypothetical protein